MGEQRILAISKNQFGIYYNELMKTFHLDQYDLIRRLAVYN